MPHVPHVAIALNKPVMNRVSSQMRLMMRLSIRRGAVIKAAFCLGILGMPATVVAQSTESIEYFHTDAIGSVRMVTGPTGEVLERRDFLPFGEELAPPPNAQPLGFGGAEQDAETANGSALPLNYFGARHLQAAIGRFITVDPGHADGTLTDPQSWNGYAYARNNPLFFVDPDGRQSCVPNDCNFGAAARAAERAGDQAEDEAAFRARSEAYWNSFFDSQSKRIILAPPPMKGSCEQYGTCLKIDWDEVPFTLATTAVWELRAAGLIGRGLMAIRAWRATRGALPAARQIAARWGASTYRHGGLMNGLEHIMYRHGPSSGFSNVSRFAAGTRGKDVVGLVDNALRYGKVTSTGSGAYTIEYSVGKVIGTDVAGNAASSLRVHVRDGIIQTAFPF